MAETLQLIITADNKEALIAIENLAKSTEGLKYKFQDVKKGTGEATNAMINFSRLAEDSAYGIRGAANNINPFIESFSRLKEKAKDSGTTIMQELIPTLIGPAGLAVAVSLISALYIKWSDYQNKAKKEAEELAKANGRGTDEIKRQKEAIDNIFFFVWGCSCKAIGTEIDICCKGLANAAVKNAFDLSLSQSYWVKQYILR